MNKPIFPILFLFTSIGLSQVHIDTIRTTVVEHEDEDVIANWNVIDSFDAVVAPNVNASSALDSSGGVSYFARNAYDWNFNTAWIPKQSYGKDEWLEYTYNKAPSDKMALTSLIFFNGYRKSHALWEANCRIKFLKLLVNNKPYAIIHLKDSYNYQTVEINPISLFKEKTVLRFEILAVYRGTKYKDVALTELELSGVGAY